MGCGFPCETVRVGGESVELLWKASWKGVEKRSSADRHQLMGDAGSEAEDLKQ